MTMVGTPIFVAPEIMMSGHYTDKVDSYSFGVCLVSCIRSEEGVLRYFQNGLRRSLKKKNLNGIGMGLLAKRLNERHWCPALPRKLYKTLKKLIHDCWHKDPTQRPTFNEIVERLTGEIHTEIDTKDEPIFTCDFEHPENNDNDYDTNGADDGDNGSDNEEEILTLKRHLKELESVKKRAEAIEEELKTMKMEKAKDEKKEEEEVKVPAFMLGMLAGR